MTTAQTPSIAEKLRLAGLRPTRQRVGLAEFLFGHGHRHLTAEAIHEAARAVGLPVSLATVYNTLHQFTRAGLLRELVVGPGRSYFDTNIDDHHHFYDEGDGRLIDIPAETITVSSLPQPPGGTEIARVDVVIRVTRRPIG